MSLAVEKDLVASLDHLLHGVGRAAATTLAEMLRRASPIAVPHAEEMLPVFGMLLLSGPLAVVLGAASRLITVEIEFRSPMPKSLAEVLERLSCCPMYLGCWPPNRHTSLCRISSLVAAGRPF